MKKQFAAVIALLLLSSPVYADAPSLSAESENRTVFKGETLIISDLLYRGEPVIFSRNLPDDKPISPEKIVPVEDIYSR